MSSQTMITAHSGADGTPDNSLVFVRHALTLPVDALEVDVRRGADGAPALGHDAAGSDAPRLDEVFALVQAHPSMQINCDLKEPGLEETVYRLALSHGLGGRVVFFRHGRRAGDRTDPRAAGRGGHLSQSGGICSRAVPALPRHPGF